MDSWSESTAPRDDAPVEPPEAGAVADSVRPKRRKGVATAKPQESKDGSGGGTSRLGTPPGTPPHLVINLLEINHFAIAVLKQVSF